MHVVSIVVAIITLLYLADLKSDLRYYHNQVSNLNTRVKDLNNIVTVQSSLLEEYMLQETDAFTIKIYDIPTDTQRQILEKLKNDLSKLNR